MSDQWHTTDGVFFEDLEHFWVLEGLMPISYKQYEWGKHNMQKTFVSRKSLVEHYIKEAEEELAKVNKRADVLIQTLNTLRTDESIVPYMVPTKKSKREKVGNIIIK
jgi:hypothetical protein